MDISTAFAFHGLHADAEAEVLETAAKSNSGLLDRARLLGYYCSLNNPTDLQVSKKLQNLLALIEHSPWEAVLAVPLAPDDARNEVIAKAWRDQTKIHQLRPDVLANAAAFLHHWDMEEAKQLLEAAIKLEPAEWKWRVRLGRVLLNGARACSESAAQWALARKALTVLKEAEAIASSRERHSFLDGLTEGALLAGDRPAATEYAEQSLIASVSSGWERGNLQHMAHTVLGALAFDGSDLTRAQRHLEESLMVPESPQFKMRGPSTHLLRRMASVPLIFEAYVRRWKARFGLPIGWALEVRTGDPIVEINVRE